MRGDDLSYTVKNTTNNSTTLPITGLQAYTNYHFFVRAVNDKGVGPYSSPFSSQTFEAGKRDIVYIYYMFMALVSGQHNARSDWLSARSERSLCSRNAHGPITDCAN